MGCAANPVTKLQTDISPTRLEVLTEVLVNIQVSTKLSNDTGWIGYEVSKHDSAFIFMVKQQHWPTLDLKMKVLRSLET
jgi:hypothetical protein